MVLLLDKPVKWLPSDSIQRVIRFSRRTIRKKCNFKIWTSCSTQYCQSRCSIYQDITMMKLLFVIAFVNSYLWWRWYMMCCMYPPPHMGVDLILPLTWEWTPHLWGPPPYEGKDTCHGNHMYFLPLMMLAGDVHLKAIYGHVRFYA